MRNTGRYHRSAQRRRKDGRHRRRGGTGSNRYGGKRNGTGRHIFNGILWTTSMIMILTLLPAESDAAKKLARLTEDGNVLAVAAGKISDFGSSSLSDDSSEKEEESSKEEDVSEWEEKVNEKEHGEEQKSGEKNRGKATDIVLTDHVSDGNGGKIPAENISKGAFSGVTAAADRASGMAATVVQKDNKGTLKQGSGNIIIYHTHATESYLPAAASNAHTTELKSTVREAGETLTARLKLHGFSVVHDMTLHDYPSYNKSYNRSLETVKKLSASYSNKKLIIDLHRDAATSSGKGKTAIIDGQKVAAFCLVVGTKNDNYDKLRAFADKITDTANKMYPGFAKPIVEKPHKFNEYVSDSYILLEVGNNANTIEEVNAAMPYLAKVLTEVIA